MVFNATWGSFYFGYQMAVLNTAEDKVATHFKWDKNDKDFYIPICVTLIPLSALVGALLGGPISKFGRRTAFLVTDVLSIVGILVILLSFY